MKPALMFSRYTTRPIASHTGCLEPQSTQREAEVEIIEVTTRNQKQFAEVGVPEVYSFYLIS